jgi:NAD(P) transhydrogenase
MEEIKTDVVVIGSGPAGQKAAIQASKLGKNVIVVEKDPQLGGACLYSGTIPSKTFRESVVDLTRFYDRHFEGQEYILPNVTIDELNFRLHKVISEERNIITRQFKKNGIRIIQGSARFENQHTLIVVDDDFRLKYQIKATNFIIATGSNPRNPPDVPFDHQVILDSTTLLRIGRVPKSMIVLGGGIIGSEYASFFAALGTEVTVIDRKDHMLPLLDAEIGIHLQTALNF